VKKSLAVMAVVVVGVFALVLPWQLRNASLHGQFTLSEVGDSTFQNWIVAKTMAQVEGLTRNEAVGIIATAPDPMTFSLQYIQDHPGAFVKEQVRGIAQDSAWRRIRDLGGKDWRRCHLQCRHALGIDRSPQFRLNL
jgi:hypothetical protein